jgi:hypothetical protein
MGLGLLIPLPTRAVCSGGAMAADFSSFWEREVGSCGRRSCLELQNRELRLGGCIPFNCRRRVLFGCTSWGYSYSRTQIILFHSRYDVILI